MVLNVTLKKRSLNVVLLPSVFLFYSFPVQASTIPLLKTASTISLPAGYSLNQFTQMNFSDSIPTYGLASDNNFFPSMTSASIPNISSYATTSSGYIILTDKSYSPIISIFNPKGSTSLNTITGDDSLHAATVGKSVIYGCSQVGDIYSINPVAVPPNSTPTSKLLFQIDYPIMKECVADTSQASDVVYSLSMDSSYQDEYLCSTSTTGTGASSCYNIPRLQVSNSNQNIMASQGIVYVTSTLKDNMIINAFTVIEGKLIPSPGFNAVSIPGAASSPLVYGSDSAGNNFIYVIVQQQNKTFQLQALNATTGTLLWTYLFASNETVSKPYVTSNGGNVLVIASSGIYGFTNTGAQAFTSGYELFFPQPSTPALQLTALDSTLSNTLDIPATLAVDGKTVIVFSMNINW